MYNFLVKKGTTVAFIAGVVIIIIFLSTTMSGLSSAGYDVGTDLVAQGKDAVKGMDFFNTGLYLTALLIIVSIGLMLFFGVLGIIKFPKKGMKSIGMFLGLIVMFFILKAIAPGDVTAKMVAIKEKFMITEGVSSFIGGGIMTTIFLITLAGAAMIFFEIRNAFK